MSLKTVFLLAATCLAAASSINLEPPKNSWVTLGQSFKLKCRASSPLKSCSWSTPNGKNYPLSKGLTAESGRFEYVGKDDMDCGISISAAEAKDLGKWTCMVSVVNGSEVVTAEGQSMVAEATEPDSIDLMGPFDFGVANVSRSQEMSVGCVVTNAKPKPVISWYVDETELVDLNVTEKEEDNVYTQTLMYTPLQEHNNKTLKCVVQHVTLEESQEASVTIIVNDEVILSEATSKEGKQDSDPSQMSSIIIAVVAFVVISFCSAILVSYSRRWFCFSYMKKSESTEDKKGDAEMEPLDKVDNPDTKSQDEKTTETEDTKPLSEEKHQKLSERFASFFRLNKSQTVSDDVEAGQVEKVDEVDKVKEELPKTEDEVKEKDAEDKPASEEVKPKKLSERFASLFNKAKHVDADVEAGGDVKEGDDETKAEEKGEKDVAEKEKSKSDIMSCLAGLCNGGVETDKDKEASIKQDDETAALNETTNEKQVEFEPEDKEATDKKESNGHIETSPVVPVQTPV